MPFTYARKAPLNCLGQKEIPLLVDRPLIVCLVNGRTPMNYRAETCGLMIMPACLERLISRATLLTPIKQFSLLTLPMTVPCVVKWLTFIHPLVVLPTAVLLPTIPIRGKLRCKLILKLPGLRVGATPMILALKLTLIQLLVTIGTL